MKSLTSGGFAFGVCLTTAILAGCGPSTNSMPLESRGDTSAPFSSRTPAFVPPLESSPTFKVLYSFTDSPDGAYPVGGVTFDNKGALYGTTVAGGSPNLCTQENTIGCGTVFKLLPSGSGYTESVLYRFGSDLSDSDGTSPMGSLVVDKGGAVYGATTYGNVNGSGVLFKLSPTPSGYTETILHNFYDPPDGVNPMAGLVAGKNGALYGTTEYGGAERGCLHLCNGCGTVFMISNSAYSSLYSFCQRSRLGRYGANPLGLVMDKNGALYGTTSSGGAHDFGNVFSLSHRTFRVLHSFCARFPCFSGAKPQAALIVDGNGALYGTTSGGGRRDNGTVFKLTPSGSGYRETILHTFRNSPDGSDPVAGLVADKTGALYGTTMFGGGVTRGCGSCGIVFKLTPTPSGYSESILHRFTGGADGGEPQAGLIFGKDGALYGTTTYGGTAGGFGDGTVFKLTP